MHPLFKKGVIEKDIMQILQEKGLVDEQTNLESRLDEDLGLDSLEKIKTLMAIETKFNITIPDENSERLLTIGDVVDYIDGAITEPA